MVGLWGLVTDQLYFNLWRCRWLYAPEVLVILVASSLVFDRCCYSYLLRTPQGPRQQRRPGAGWGRRPRARLGRLESRVRGVPGLAG